MSEVLGEEQVRAGLATLPGWQGDAAALHKRFELASFADAIAFVVRIGFHAEAADHHPDLDVRWRNVDVTLSTHTAGGVTARDLDLATLIEASVPS